MGEEILEKNRDVIYYNTNSEGFILMLTLR